MAAMWGVSYSLHEVVFSNEFIRRYPRFSILMFNCIFQKMSMLTLGEKGNWINKEAAELVIQTHKHDPRMAMFLLSAGIKLRESGLRENMLFLNMCELMEEKLTSATFV